MSKKAQEFVQVGYRYKGKKDPVVDITYDGKSLKDKK